MIDPDGLVESARQAFAAAADPAELERVKARFLGKAGVVTEALKSLANLPLEERKRAGAAINRAKAQIETLLEEAREALARRRLEAAVPKRSRTRSSSSRSARCRPR